MLTQTAESHFGGRAGIAKVLTSNGMRTVSAVYQWEKVVPLAAARQLETLSNGVCKVDDELYDQYGRIIRKQRRAS